MTVTNLGDPAVTPSAIAPVDDQAAPSSPPPALTPGTRVEVRRRLDSKWASGFEVAEATTQGYRVRRMSDGELIPIPIVDEDVRKEKKRGNWWY